MDDIPALVCSRIRYRSFFQVITRMAHHFDCRFRDGDGTCTKILIFRLQQRMTIIMTRVLSVNGLHRRFVLDFVFGHLPTQKPCRPISTAVSMTLHSKSIQRIYFIHILPPTHDQTHHEYMVDKILAWHFSRIRLRSSGQPKT
jgi:hypothetical protein